MASLNAVSCLFFQAAVLQWFLIAEASHFRYGTISWAPVDSYSNTLRFTFRLAFRRSFSSSYYCDQSTIGSGSLLGSGGSWYAKCNYCSSTTIASTGFHCTDYSSNEDWSVGENNFNYTFSFYDRWVVSYSSCCWISLSRYGNGAWFISTTVNLTRRSDNGKINSSPVSRSPAIVRWSEGCPSQSLRIPVEDADGDVVKCRYANYSESYFYSDSFPYGTFDEKTCLLTYNGNYGTAGTYAVALTLEDFPAGTTNFDSITPFSAVGLQFLVIISSHSGSCNNVPVFTPSTPNDGECTEVQIGSLYRAVIEATLADYSKSIVEIVTSSPPGMQFTSLSFHGGVYYRNITWYPNQYQVGKQSFCFKAVDSSGMGTEWRCVTILVGISSTPRVVWGSQTPQSPLSNSGLGYIWWSIQFDRVIKKPRTSSFIRLVLLPSGHTVHKVDTLSQFAKINSSNRNTLRFAMPYAALSMNGSYAILMDRGAVVGQGCSYDGPPTPGITNTSDWQFTAGFCPVGYTLAPPDFSNCVDINECGSPSRSKRSFYHNWWGYTMSSSTQWLTTEISPSTSSSYLPFTASFPGSCSSHIYNYYGSGGNLYSPGYPGCYADNLMCTWLIEAPFGYYVYLSIYYFSLEYGWSSCPYDFLEIRDGNTLSSPLITKACGSLGYFYVYSSDRFLLLRFRTDGSVQGAGFAVYYSTVSYRGSNWIPSHQVSSTRFVACVPSQTLVTRISTTLPITPTTSSSYIPSTMSYSDHDLTGLNNSVIVGNNSDHLSNLTYWLRPVMRNGTDWKLCWRASRDGWNSNTFHSLCDEKGPTITIIRVGKYIFGGYTSLPWPNSTYCKYGYDSETFIFSLVNEPGWAPVKLNQSGDNSRLQYSIYSCSYYGPTFGGGNDIYIPNNAAYSSSSSYLYTYSPPSGYSSGRSSFLAGSYYFTPDEIETFFYKTFIRPEALVIGLNNSVIVGNNSEYLSNLTNWIKPRKSESDWKLCWRASRDGWDSSRFHSLCDEKGPTVTIVKVGKYIFGGYTGLSWSSDCVGYRYDPQAFLFSLVNSQGWAPVKFNQTERYSYYTRYSTYSCYHVGPTFGGGHDLQVGYSPYNHYSNLGYTYSPPRGYSYGSSFARSFLAGSYYFNPDEVETFYDANFTSQASTRTISPSYTTLSTTSPSLLLTVSASISVSSTSPSVSASVPVSSDREVTGLNNSVIVGNSSDYLSNLTHWLRPVMRNGTDWKLCWRASRDGWNANTFHYQCDEKGPTITIIKVGKYIFGGYTSLPWPNISIYCAYGYDQEAFLFSLVNEPGWAPVKLSMSSRNNSAQAIGSCSTLGPIFGGGHDIYIANNAAYSSSSFSYLYTYSPPSGYSYDRSTFLAGSFYFTPNEIETFFYKPFIPKASTRTTGPSYTASSTASPSLSPSSVSPGNSPSVSASVSLSSECSNHTYLEDYRRAQGFYNGPSGYYQCDNNLPAGWYRFRGPAGTQMASTCIGVNRCGSHGPGWLSTQHPLVSDGIVNATACFHWGGSCCLWSINVRVRNCSGFYVYELRPTPSCHYRYCGDGEAASYSLSSSTGVRASKITPSSSSGYYAPSSLYALPAPLDFQFHVPSDCEQLCTNTPGSYRCSCVSGYQLSSDGKSCADIDECSTNNGGCSHHCYNIPGSFYCGCPEGTTMANNNLTCVEPGVSVACDENNMTVSLEKLTFPFFNVSSLHLRYYSCRATENSSHFLISTPLNSCGTLVNETEDALMFWNEIRADAVIIDNVITRTHDIKFKFYCSYSRRKMLSIQFQPQNIFIGSEAGYGNFTFRMDFYKTAAFATPYTENDYPILVALNEYLYVKYSVESSASNELGIMAENCKATRYGSFYSWPYYNIIQNGCEQDTTMEYTYNPSASSQQLKIRSFRFFNDYDVVYFHCELLACYRGSPNSRCSKSCLSSKRRKRRGAVEDEIEHEESTSTHILSSGPIMIKETETEERDKGDTGKSQQTALIGGAAAAGGLALIVIIGLAVLAVKYRIARRFMNRNKVGDLYTTQDEQMSRRNAYIQEDDMIEKEDSF